MASNTLDLQENSDSLQPQLQPLFEHWVDLSAAAFGNPDDYDDKDDNCDGGQRTAGQSKPRTTTTVSSVDKFQDSDSTENLSIFNNLNRNYNDDGNNSNPIHQNTNILKGGPSSQVQLKISPAMHSIAVPDLSLIPNTDLRLLRVHEIKSPKLQVIPYKSSSSSSCSSTLTSSRGCNCGWNRVNNDLATAVTNSSEVGGNGENVCEFQSSDSSVGKDSHKKDTLSPGSSSCSSTSSHNVPSNCGAKVVPAPSTGGSKKRFRSSSVQCQNKRCDSPHHHQQRDQKGRGSYVTNVTKANGGGGVKRSIRR